MRIASPRPRNPPPSAPSSSPFQKIRNFQQDEGAFPMREPKDLQSRQVLGVRVGVGILALLVAAFTLIVLSGAQPARASGAPAVQITPDSGRYHTVTVVT